MTAKPKVTVKEQAAEPMPIEAPQDEEPRCGAPHQLALLAHLHCSEPAGHDGPGGSRAALHPHRVVHDGTLYVWA